jgi:16S rRNA (guanine527-N7)-methyltransferase
MTNTQSRHQGVSADELAGLLQPFAAQPPVEWQLAAISAYLELLLRWNARLNLTAVRDPKHIVTRHIGESWFAAERLFPDPAVRLHAIDLGSGAGFPGLPLRVYAPRLKLTLLESQHKKATFLKEAVRAMGLSQVEVFAGRAEEFAGQAEIVTLRAVERFERVLPVAASLLEHQATRDSVPSRLALLIGASQVAIAQKRLSDFRWNEPIALPQANARVLLVGTPEVKA